MVEALDAGGLRHYTPLDVPTGPGGDNQGIGSRLGHPDQRLAEVEGRLTLGPLLDRLPVRQQEILALRFGSGCSQSEIARRIGVSQMQVSRLLAKSLAQLRSWSAEAG